MEIVSRAAWGPLPQAQLSPIEWPPGPLLVHHTVTGAPATEAQTFALLRAIDRDHYYRMPARGGIGYNYAVSPAGQVIECRGRAMGAHTVGRNDWPAVALLGTYSSTPPPLPMRQAVWQLADHLSRRGLSGHRQWNQTTCPGEAAMRALVLAPRPPERSAAEARRQLLDSLPAGATLRLVLGPARQGGRSRAYAGWRECAGPLEWIALHGLDPTAIGAGLHALAWRGHVWRGADAVTGVARNLVRRFL